MSVPTALQLYSVREQLKADFAGVVRQVAAMGYAGVEMVAGFSSLAPNAGDLFKELGLKVTSVHGSLPVGDKQNEVLDQLAAWGTDTIICPWTTPERFQTLDGIKGVADMLNEGYAVARAFGFRVGYHNHHFELIRLPDGSIPLLRLMEYVDPAIIFEVDTYWVQVGGVNVVELLQTLGSRAPLLHIKDGPGVHGQPMTAVGDGVMDWPPIIQAAAQPEWLIVELDACATDMIEAVDRSHRYLVSKGYGHGTH